MPSRARRKPRSAFDPAPHRAALEAILAAVAEAPALDARGLDRILRRHPRSGRGLFAKSELVAGLRAFGARGGLDEAELLARLRLRPVRTLSGVTPVTVLTRPFPCPGACVFCPNDVRMPKSYLADEPGAQRAEDNHFDPYRQTWSRLEAYRSMGHPTAKVELIVLGGTWSHYPADYQRWFVRRCFEALNDFGAGRDGRGETATTEPSGPAPLDGRHLRAGDYNRAVARAASAGAVPAPAEPTDWAALEAAQRANEAAGARCVGLVLETRPDAIDAEELRRLRRLGATKLQLGVQSLDDAILARNQRGHDVAATRRALRLARAAGFKLHAHWMPNLLGATPESDAADYRRLFDDPDFRPDELKLYPCLLVPSAELARHHARGEWRPYDDATLGALLADCIEATPHWVRLTRVVRDFSAHDVAAGTHTANLREVAERSIAARGGVIREIRHREQREAPTDAAALALRSTAYATSLGEERFLEWVDPRDRLAGFARLALPAGDGPFAELAGCALLREVHVYGASLAPGARQRGAAQHAGLGRALVQEAARQARAAGFAELAVIAAVGTRAWYRRLGFRDAGLYPRLALRGL